MTNRIKYIALALGLLILIVMISDVLFVVLTPKNSQKQSVDTPQTTQNAVAYNAYIGHMRCAECHADTHKSHLTSPHSRTLTTAKASNIATLFCGQKHFGGEDFGTFEYICDDEGLAVSLRERFPDRLFPLDYAFGSGKHAVTFLTLLQDKEETVAVEHRMSWFRNSSKVDVTPGQSKETPGRDMDCFGKIFRGKDMHRCFNCHITTGRIVDGRVENLTAGVHCEKCHGPGAAHASAAENGNLVEAKNSIRHGWTASEEIAMCGECHRMPQEITSTRLKDYPNSLVRFQPVGLLQSRCYLNSSGVMKCTTCHDAHEDVHSRTAEVQVESCRKCHSTDIQKACSAGETSKCIDCHMPAVELIPGVSFHDHWIRVRDGKSQENKAAGDEGHSEAHSSDR